MLPLPPQLREPVPMYNEPEAFLYPTSCKSKGSECLHDGFESCHASPYRFWSRWALCFFVDVSTKCRHCFDELRHRWWLLFANWLAILKHLNWDPSPWFTNCQTLTVPFRPAWLSRYRASASWAPPCWPFFWNNRPAVYWVSNSWHRDPILTIAARSLRLIAWRRPVQHQTYHQRLSKPLFVVPALPKTQ